MSELIAEARVLVTPETAAFRGLLTAQLAAATKGVVVPVAVTPVAAPGASAALQQTVQATTATRALTAAKAEGVRITESTAAAEARHARQLSQLQRGAAATALSMTGLRGATLASTGPFLAGAAALTVFAKSAASFAQFETSLNTFRVTADATSEEMDQISATAIKLGRDLTLPGVTAQSAAEGLAQLSRAGLSVEDSLGGIRGTLQLATAASIDTETAVVLVANALNAFSLAGTEASKVADLLANASKESQGSIEDVGLALQQSAAAARQAGISVEDTIALLTQLGRAGLRGSDAGTSLRVAFLRLINPTKQAREQLDLMNVAIRDQEGNVRPEVFGELTEALSKLTKAQEDAALATIFGQDAFRAASIIGRQGVSGLNQIRDATQEAGAAAELASARTQGLAGASENLKNQLSAVGLAIGGGLNRPLTDVVNALADGTAGIGRFIGFLGSLGDEAEETGTKLERANREFAELVDTAGRVNRAVDAAKALGDADEDLIKLQEELNKKLEETQPAGLKAASGIEAVRASAALAAQAVEGLRNRLDESVDRFARTPVTPPPVAPTRQRVSQLQGLASLAQSEGDLREAQRIQEQILANAVRAERAGIHKGIEARQRLFDERIAAEAALNSTKRQIAERVGKDVQATAKDVDQALLGSQQNARAIQENQVARAQATEGVADDIRENIQLRALIRRQIEVVREQVGDVKTRQAAVNALVAATISLTSTIRGLRAARQAEREAQRQAILDRTAENADLRIAIAEARGNKDAVVRLLDARIKIANQQVARAKKAKEGVLAAILELEKLKQKRRELLQEASDISGEGGGTTAFDLLTQAAGRFTGGNIIGAAQPFAGPTEFTADLSQFLRRNATTSTAPTAAKSPFAGFTGSADRLVEAINRNTAALNGGEAGPPVRKGKRPPVSKAVGNTFRGWWQFADEARDQVEGAG